MYVCKKEKSSPLRGREKSPIFTSFDPTTKAFFATLATRARAVFDTPEHL
jgi:hypothetical protein